MTKKTDVSLSGNVGLSRCVPTHRLISNPIVSETRPRCQWGFCRIGLNVLLRRHYVQSPPRFGERRSTPPHAFSSKHEAHARLDVFFGAPQPLLSLQTKDIFDAKTSSKDQSQDSVKKPLMRFLERQSSDRSSPRSGLWRGFGNIAFSKKLKEPQFFELCKSLKNQ